MPIQYPTEIEISGPWLLDDKALLQLEEILDDEWNRLESRRKSLIEKEALEKVQRHIEAGFLEKDSDEEKENLEKYINDPSYTLARNNRKTNLFLKSKGTYSTEKFSSALRDNTLLNEIVTGFSVDIESADIRCKVYTKSWSNELIVDVSPETANEAREIYVALRNWAEKNSPPYWQQLWRKLSDINWYLWFSAILIGALVWSMAISSSTASAKQRARDMLNSGITQQNSTEAIELLLIMQTEYDPVAQPVNRELPSWLKIIFWSGLILNVLLSFKAKTPLLGIGKGRTIISSWQIW